MRSGEGKNAQARSVAWSVPAPTTTVCPAEPTSRESDLEAIFGQYPELRGVPAAVLLHVGAYDADCAGGCG